jgi:hypothetical protein
VNNAKLVARAVCATHARRGAGTRMFVESPERARAPDLCTDFVGQSKETALTMTHPMKIDEALAVSR